MPENISCQDNLYLAQQVREMDRRAIEKFSIPGYELMQRAAGAVFDLINRLVNSPGKIAVVCGSGNNAGDGYVIARLAKAAKHDVVLVALSDHTKLKGDAKKAADDWLHAGGLIDNSTDINLTEFDYIIDAILGTGLQREVSGIFAEMIDKINNSLTPVIAVDIPSGIHADTGQLMGHVVKAYYTVTFIAAKQGLYTGRARDYTGEIIFNDLQVPAEVLQGIQASSHLLNKSLVKTYLHSRDKTAHKGDFGHVLLIGGDEGMSGAIRLAATAALRVGAGLVSIATRAQHAALINSQQAELMCHGIESLENLKPLLQKATVIVIGPGLGQREWGKLMLSAALQSDKPLLVDADGLNLLAGEPYQRSQWVLTPHPGEAGRLLACNSKTIEADRHQAIASLVKAFNAEIVLKGAATLVAGPNSKSVALCAHGNPGMASGGMGDVLSGIIGGFIAQQIPLAVAAKLGVYIHAQAGDQAVLECQAERGLLASDLFPYLRRLVNPE